MIIIIIIFLCYRARRVVRERQSPALAAMQASGLPSIYPMANVLLHTLQRLTTIEQHHRDHPLTPFSSTTSAVLGLNSNFLSSNALKF